MSTHTEGWPRPHRLTVHDYTRMGEVGLLSRDDRTELIEGEIIDLPPIGRDHASVCTLLTRRLIRAVDSSVEVRVLCPVRFMPRSESQPDVALVKRTVDAYREHAVAKDVVLLIEVSDSTLHYDLDVKARLYATHGVPEYWVVDLVSRRVVRHHSPTCARYTGRDDVTSGALTLPTLDATISIAELF